MKIVIAPDSFKESLSAYEACQAIERGFREIIPNAVYEKIPMADGGEGTVQSLVNATGGTILETYVTGPLGEQVLAFYGLLGDGKTAVIEMAASSGLHLVPMDQRNPLLTTTRGLGELISAALDQGATSLIIGLGGSATNDGGAGMIQALGARLLDMEGKEIPPGGGGLSHLVTIDLSTFDPRVRDVVIQVACDVDNPLTGPTGASAIYGPQKGATPELVEQLDKNLNHFANVYEKQLKKYVRNYPGAGAAGGLGAGLMAFLSAELKSGVEIVLETLRFEDQMKDADLVITGEGKIDSQTIFGKTPIGVAKTAKKFGIPVIALCGSYTEDSKIVHNHGIDALFTIVPGTVTLTDAIKNAAQYMEQTARNIAAAIPIKC
ncbi:glycerate kinase [Mesobacillus maritimus]|uniref:Glycerate kinase n=1 Tax=Mesobacillus maritimus TaxID=1643336 RepID=A0ABS7K8D9_9BACI|nr:glycerate kinase [Mesobacillus maritimus]MBY0098385.1 glycerate kinase [Mesobacillus maritimus]